MLETMASGLPVIASDIEPLTEYLKNEENSILVPPMDYETLASWDYQAYGESSASG